MSERFSVIIRVIGYLRQLQYEVFNMTLESYEQERNALGKTPKNVMPFTFKASTCEEQTSVMGYNLLYLDKLPALPH